MAAPRPDATVSVLSSAADESHTVKWKLPNSSGIDGTVSRRSGGHRLCRLRAVAQVLAACMIYWQCLGDIFSSGMIHASLLLPPCTDLPHGPENSTAIVTQAGENASLPLSSLIGADNASWVSDLNDSLPANVVNDTSHPETLAVSCGGFGQSAAGTAWVASLTNAVRLCCSCIGGILVDTFGMRTSVIGAVLVCSVGLLLSSFATHLWHLYLAKGVLFGLGAGILTVAPVHSLAVTFREKLSIASGIMYGGGGLGAVVYGFLGREVIAAGSWLWFFRMQAAFLMLLGVPAAFLVDSPEVHLASSRTYPRESQASRTTPMSMLVSFLKVAKILYRDANFRLLIAVFVFYSLSIFVSVVVSSHRLQLLGVNMDDANLQTVYIGAGVFSGAVFYSAIGTWIGQRCILAHGCCLFVLGALNLFSILVTTETGLGVYIVSYCFAAGFNGANASPTAKSLLSAEMSAHGFGHVLLWSTLPTAISSPVAGWIYDATRSYTWSLVFGGSSLLLSSVLAFILHWRVRQMRQRNRVSTEDAPDHKCVDEDSRLAAAKLQESSTARAESAPQIHLYETSL